MWGCLSSGLPAQWPMLICLKPAPPLLAAQVAVKPPSSKYDSLFKELQWGGDLKIGVRGARGLLGMGRTTVLFAKVRVCNAFVTL